MINENEVSMSNKERKVLADVYCDVCGQRGMNLVVAEYDAKTTYGPWAYLCEEHFQKLGMGLGLGKGQKLIKENEDD